MDISITSSHTAMCTIEQLETALMELIAASQGPASIEDVTMSIATEEDDGKVVDIPSYIDKHSSFMSLNAPDEIMEGIVGTLKIFRCDVRLFPEKQHYVDATYFCDCDSVDFHITIFREPPDQNPNPATLAVCPNRHLVEVQRFSGDSTLFCRFYKTFIRTLRREFSSVVDSYAVPTKQLSPMVSPRKQREEENAQRNRFQSAGHLHLSDQLTNNLFGMAQSRQRDSQRYGILRITRGMRNSCMTQEFVQTFLPILKDLLCSSKDRYVLRCSILCFECICANISYRHMVVGLLDMVLSITEHSDSDEIKRHALNAIHLLSDSHANNFSQQNLQTLSGFLNYPDCEISKCVTLTLKKFQAMTMVAE